MFEYTVAEISSQIRSLPLVLSLWLRFLGALNLSSVLLLRRRQARWVFGAILFIIATNVPIFLSFGLVKLGSIPHLFVWIPLVIYLAKQVRSGQVDIKKPFGMWCFALMILNLVSIVFDMRDGVQYLLGDHAAMPQGLSPTPPVPTLLAIVVVVFAAVRYSLGDSPSRTNVIHEPLER